ncbi:MAG: glycosyltransferase [Lachnospiraceae bacterium]|nr:glycosyltransferase [Lachnospiraceae bacterium]
MKKILFITHQLSRTGAPIVLLDMIRICKDAGYDISLISLLEGELRTEIEEMGISIEIKDDFFNDRDAFRPYAESFDTVICNTLICYQVIHVMNGSHTPVIWWIHEGEQYFDYFKKVLPNFKNLTSNIKVFSVGHYVQEVIKRRYDADTSILHFGVRDVSRDISCTINPWLYPDRMHFVTSGTYSAVKAQDVLCKAIELLPEEDLKRCEFLFCGKEDMVDDEVFSAVSALCGRYENVHKLSSLSHDKMMEVMATMDYLIVPSRVDPIPTVAAEAMMMNRPCIITDVCGIAHYLKDGDNAYTCPPDDPNALCEKIREALNRPLDYAGLCFESRKVYDEHFSYDLFKDKVLSLIENRPKDKLIFAVGVYDILDIFTYELIPAFEELGYETFLFDSKDMVKSLGLLYDFIKTPVKACITFNNLAFNTEITPGTNLWEALNIPVINILMDHPFCHKKALDDAPSNAIVLCPDRNHMRYMQRFYPTIPTVGFLGHGGKLLPGPVKPITERSIDILYAGGISRKFAYEMMPDFAKYNFDAKSVADNAYALMLEHPSLTTEEAIETCLNNAGINLSDPDLCTLIEELHYIDLLIVSHFRELTVRTLAEAGLHITLYGTGWDVCEWIQDCPTLDFKGRVSAYEIVELMKDTKCVLSTMTWFKDGTHDRVFNGMLQGAFTVTDSSVYMREEFVSYNPASDNYNDAELFMFELSEIASLPDALKAIFSSSEKMQTMANNGRKKALSSHTWAARAKELHEDLLKYL